MMDTAPALIALGIVCAAVYLFLTDTKGGNAAPGDGVGAALGLDPWAFGGQDAAFSEGTGQGGADGAQAPLQPITETIIDTMKTRVTSLLGLWHAPEKYAQVIMDAEDRSGIPRSMLERLLYQESRYRDDIITGAVRSPVGALGIAQFMPATARDMGVDPLDPVASIYAAGRYLAQLYRMTGTWTEALAAYNWGVGNVQRKGLSRAPMETRNYYAQILGDVNTENGTDYA